MTGRGAGAGDDMLTRKIAVIEGALALHRPDPADPLGVLAAVGGLEHAALAGFILGAAARRVPVIVDGVIAASAACVAAGFDEAVAGYLIAGHAGVEPGIKAALTWLDLQPLVDLDLRLGEGTGAALALPTVQAAAQDPAGDGDLRLRGCRGGVTAGLPRRSSVREDQARRRDPSPALCAQRVG